MSQLIETTQQEIDKRLGLDVMSPERRFRATSGHLCSENKLLAERALQLFDKANYNRLLNESRQLSSGVNGTTSDSSMPAIFERTLVREAYYNLVGTQFVQANVDDFSASYAIPYSYRKNIADYNGVRTYEGIGISRSGLAQGTEIAYPIPQKLSFEVSDELSYLATNKKMDWDIVTENLKNAARIIGEDTDTLIFNEQVQASDEWQAMPVVEDLSDKGNSSKVVLLGEKVTTVCRPRVIRGLEGSQIGNTLNPVTVTIDGVAIQEYQSYLVLPSGIYYVLNYDIGEIYLVDDSGNLINPTGKAWVIAYSRVTNVDYFDMDVPVGVKSKEHWDNFLRVYALRKTLIEDGRLHQAMFGLMSGALMTEIEQAEKFQASNRVAATDLAVTGNLGLVKGVPNWKTSAPHLWLGDRRVMIGEIVTRLKIVKPWTMGQLENQRDQHGHFTGRKEAYGDQFIALLTPKPLKGGLTSIVVYNASARVARNNP